VLRILTPTSRGTPKYPRKLMINTFDQTALLWKISLELDVFTNKEAVQPLQKPSSMNSLGTQPAPVAERVGKDISGLQKQRCCL